MHRRRVGRIDADDANLRMHVFEIGGDTGDEAAAADRNEHGIDVAARLPRDLHADRALSGDDVRVIERMDEDHLPLAGDDQRAFVGTVVVITVQYDLATQISNGLNLDARSRHRHHDHRRDLPPTGRQGDPLRVIACRGADHSARSRVVRKTCDLVVGPTQLEGEGRLQIFTLEQNLVADSTRQT